MNITEELKNVPTWEKLSVETRKSILVKIISKEPEVKTILENGIKDEELGLVFTIDLNGLCQELAELPLQEAKSVNEDMVLKYMVLK